MKLVLKISIVTAAVLMLAAAAAAQVSPAAVVQNLYKARAHNSTDPFFQTRSRSRLDLYFTRDFGDLIWKDRVAAGDEAGFIDFDPLYNAQDTKITRFKVGKPEYGEGNANLADVAVSFRNMGEAQTVLFRLLKVRGAWKIDDIMYPGEKLMPSLKQHLVDNLKDVKTPVKRRTRS